MWPSTEKILLPLLLFAFSLRFADGKTSIVIKKLINPHHAGVGARQGNYARTYVYGEPLPNYRTEIGSRSIRVRGRRENSLRNYASRYKTWFPYKDGYRVREPQIGDGKQFGKMRRPRPPYPARYSENDVFYHRRPGRPNKKRPGGHISRPNPHVDEEFDTEDYLAGETKRNEAQYSFRDGPRRPAKKRRNPTERKKKHKKPISYSKPSFDDDDRRIVFDDDRKVIYSEDGPEFVRYKQSKEPTVSYSTFIQHSPAVEFDYEYPDDEDARPPSPRKKKRRIKKKTNKYNDEAEFEEYRLEKYSPEIESYTPIYQLDANYDTDSRSKIKLKKYKPESKPSFAEDYISNENPSSIVYSQPNHFRSPSQDEYVSHHQSSQHFQAFNTVSHPQTQPITNPSQPYRASYDSHPYSSLIQYNKITQPSRDFFLQPSTIYGYGSANPSSHYSEPQGGRPVSKYESSAPGSSGSSIQASYHNTQSYREPPQQSTIYYSSGSVDSDSSYQKEVSTSYKANQVYDSTDSFSDFNGNAGGHKKYSTYSSKYSERGNSIVPSLQITEKPDEENDFLRKHQNLYNNGISGIPVQGDGYTGKNTGKDYDIGYGEFQFDENPA